MPAENIRSQEPESAEDSKFSSEGSAVISRGDKVEVCLRKKSGPEWVPAKVVKVHRDGGFDVRYQDGELTVF